MDFLLMLVVYLVTIGHRLDKTLSNRVGPHNWSNSEQVAGQEASGPFQIT